MRLTIAAIGKLRAGPASDLVQDYTGRTSAIARQLGFSGPEVSEAEAPKGLTGQKRQAREGELLIKPLQNNAALIALDERGNNTSSKQLADMLAMLRDDGSPEVAFLIGGADGHSKALLDRANKKISFGAATWPHMLVRVMLAEQLYRSMTILSGHPYHRS